MANFQPGWLFGTKVVAYIDLVMLTIYLLFAIFFTPAGVIDVATDLFHNVDNKVAYTLMIFSTMGILIVCFITLTYIQVSATAHVLFASDVRTVKTSTAVDNTLHWRKISLIFILFAVMGCAVLPIWYSLLMIAWRFGANFVVSNYTKELLGIHAGSNNIRLANSNRSANNTRAGNGTHSDNITGSGNNTTHSNNECYFSNTR